MPLGLFTDNELDYLRSEDRLARVATVGADGTPHVTPVGMWSLDEEGRTIVVRGHGFESTKKFRDVSETERVAIVVDDVLPPFRPRGVLVRGRGVAVGGDSPHIRIIPERIISWGVGDDDGAIGSRNARDVPPEDR